MKNYLIIIWMSLIGIFNVARANEVWVHITQDETNPGVALMLDPYSLSSPFHNPISDIKDIIKMNLDNERVRYVDKDEQLVFWISKIEFINEEGTSLNFRESIECQITIEKRHPKKNVLFKRVKGAEIESKVIDINYSFDDRRVDGISAEGLNDRLTSTRQNDKGKFLFAWYAGKEIAEWINNNYRTDE